MTTTLKEMFQYMSTNTIHLCA